MRYQGSEAVRLDGVERRQPQQHEQRRPSFEVVNGSGLDARVRQGVSQAFVSKIRMAVVAITVLVVLGACRVALCTATVTALQGSSSLRSDIKTAQALEDDLQIERSVLSNGSRIVKIATQDYGMVLASDTETMVVSTASASSDAGTSAESSQSSDGDVTQGADGAGQATPEA